MFPIIASCKYPKMGRVQATSSILVSSSFSHLGKGRLFLLITYSLITFLISSCNATDVPTLSMKAESTSAESTSAESTSAKDKIVFF